MRIRDVAVLRLGNILINMLAPFADMDEMSVIPHLDECKEVDWYCRHNGGYLEVIVPGDQLPSKESPGSTDPHWRLVRNISIIASTDKNSSAIV